MAAHTKFFPAFHRHLFGRPPVGKARLLERKACEADQLCLTQLHTLFADVLPSWLPCYKAAQGANSRHRVYTPFVTFWAFLAQTLDADGSCRRAVTGETGSGETGSVCKKLTDEFAKSQTNQVQH